MADPKQERQTTAVIELLWAAWGAGTPLLLLGALSAGFSGWGDPSSSYLRWAMPLLVAGVMCGLLAPVFGLLVAGQRGRRQAAWGFAAALGFTVVVFGFVVVKFVG